MSRSRKAWQTAHYCVLKCVLVPWAQSANWFRTETLSGVQMCSVFLLIQPQCYFEAPQSSCVVARVINTHTHTHTHTHTNMLKCSFNMKIPPCWQHKYAAHPLNPEEHGSNAQLYIVCPQIQTDYHSHSPPQGCKNKLKIWHLSFD